MMLPLRLKESLTVNRPSLSLRKYPIVYSVKQPTTGLLDWSRYLLDMDKRRRPGGTSSRSPSHLGIIMTWGLPFVVLRRSLDHVIGARRCICMRSRPYLDLPDPQICCRVTGGPGQRIRMAFRPQDLPLAMLSLCAALATLSSISYGHTPGLAVPSPGLEGPASNRGDLGDVSIFDLGL
jgi:hypothetical protein